MKGDTPIELVDITKLSLDDHEAMLYNIRERRLKPVKAYEELTLMKEEARKANCLAQYERQMGMFEKELARVDKAMEKVEARHIKLRALKLEIDG